MSSLIPEREFEGDGRGSPNHMISRFAVVVELDERESTTALGRSHIGHPWTAMKPGEHPDESDMLTTTRGLRFTISFTNL